MKKFILATLVAAGCSTLPVTIGPTSSASSTPALGPASVTVDKVADTRVEAGALVQHKGDTTIRVTFAGFPVQGYNGSIDQKDTIGFEQKGWAVTALTGQGRISDLVYAASFVFDHGARYGFRILSDKGIFVDAEKAQHPGLGQGYPSGQPNHPETPTTFVNEVLL